MARRPLVCVLASALLAFSGCSYMPQRMGYDRNTGTWPDPVYRTPEERAASETNGVSRPGSAVAERKTGRTSSSLEKTIKPWLGVPYLYGGCLIHESKITAAVRCNVPPIAMQFGEPTEIEKAIGANVAAEIPDGACLQIGVGGIPNAILNGIKHHKHLGLHTEAMTDGVIRLMKEGVIDNSLKKVHPGVSIAALALGSKEMYEFIDHNKTMEFYDVAYTNNPFLIAQNPKACAINSALEVDLTGQVCADSIGEMIFSGVGGQHDFMYGCSLSEGGKCFIALPSRTNKGKGKIVPTLTPGAGVVTTRFQTQYVATEWGIAYLRGKNLAQRAKALIAIAHPDDREELEKAACKRFGYSFLRLK